MNMRLSAWLQTIILNIISKFRDEIFINVEFTRIPNFPLFPLGLNFLVPLATISSNVAHKFRDGSLKT